MTDRMMRANYKGCRCCGATQDERCDDRWRIAAEIRDQYMGPMSVMSRAEYWAPYGGDPMFGPVA